MLRAQPTTHAAPARALTLARLATTAVGMTAVGMSVVTGASLKLSPPALVSGPECNPGSPQCEGKGGGPWWDKVHTLSDTHAIGWAEDHLIVTRDAGRTWANFTFTDECPDCDGSLSTVAPAAAPPGSSADVSAGAFRNVGSLNLTQGTASNITGTGSVGSTLFYLTAAGGFGRRGGGAVTVDGLPHLRNLRPGSGDSLRLPDGSLVATSISVLETGPGYLSCIAIRSTDNGTTWQFAAVVTAWAEVPYAHEGPSESALALLNNGTLICIMRVEGQSGRYSPYISKLSDDGGLSWHSLRSLATGGSGGVKGAGCVRPRLLSLTLGGTRALVLSGGRPNPLSRDVLLWLNPTGDGEGWQPYSVSYWHNQLVANASWAFPAAATNASRSFPRLSTSYTSLVRTGPSSGYVVYGMGVRSFAMPFELMA